jgi:sialic acid synthase SpsE
MAHGQGIHIQEKHITHDRSFEGADHEAALNPDEFAHFVEMLRTLDGAEGVSHPRPFSPQEKKYRKYSKKSLVASRELEQGRTLEEADLKAMRANSLGCPPNNIDRLVGKSTRRSYEKHELIDPDELK